jgi:hypothetical protein
MKKPLFLATLGVATLGFFAAVERLVAQDPREIPEPLKPWTGWALWDEHDLDSPRPYHDAKQPLRLWPGRLDYEARGQSGSFTLSVTTFAETWVPLPGDAELWPMDVKHGETPLTVVEQGGRPVVKLAAGTYSITGNHSRVDLSQRVAIPREIGILRLTLDGEDVPFPAWDANGLLWLRRDATTDRADEDFLGLKVFSILEDGIPMWLQTEIELIVAGESREETLGHILPEGWQAASVDSPIPVALDDAGMMKAQVRPGKWTLRITAYRIDNPSRIAFAENTEPAAAEQLVAFRAAPDLRLVEVTGLAAVDVSQTQFPEKWRQYPVYRWETSESFGIEERMRGMGDRKPEGISISRELWLDENGGAFTFRDRITGTMQQIWRLDAKPDQVLGSVQTEDAGRLITRNPQSGASGVEIRSRELDLVATGRASVGRVMPATGWQVDAAKAEVTLNLPPGWRLLALFGADWVEGDWLTAWSLLDLFLLLLLTLAVLRLWGIRAALLAFIGFGLAYHEPDAPRYLWLVLLIPLALLRVVPQGWGRWLLVAGKWVVVLLLVLVLVPFIGGQIQQALYPQLENVPHVYRESPTIVTYSASIAPEVDSKSWGVDPFASSAEASGPRRKSASRQTAENLQYDLKARIQTGPGVPEWEWRQVSYGWSGPVTEGQSVRPVLIPAGVERAISLARVLLLLALAAVLLGLRRPRLPGAPSAIAVMVFLTSIAVSPQAVAEIPDKETLETLRQRLTETSDAFPSAADIPRAALTLRDGKLTVDAEIHAATRTAVLLPIKLGDWTPRGVRVNGEPQSVLRRNDGFLWLVLPEGTHQVRIDGLLSSVSEWQWSWKLGPRHIEIDAPGWLTSGVKPGGIPESQVFFTREARTSGDGAAEYDRPNVRVLAAVERQIELGLVWEVSSSIGRLSSGGGAVSLRIPLLPGENVITPGANVRDGFIEVRLGAGQDYFSWDSEIDVRERIEITSRENDNWIEHWILTASPVWNVEFSGLAPVFEEGDSSLTPHWRPWPGEGVALEISRPEAIAGATVTVDRAHYEITTGKRQRMASLTFSARSTLGEEFPIQIPPGAQTSSLSSNGKSIPIRRDGNQVILPLTPGSQNVVLNWIEDVPLEFQTRAGEVRLPAETANIKTTLRVPDDRWVLWTPGPLRGPAVRFWGILVGALLAAFVLGRLPASPLRSYEWMLLAIGLTQIPLPFALIVVAWLFVLAWRGGDSYPKLNHWLHHLLQLFLAFITLVALGIFIGVVAEGLLGNPEMFIRGNGSSSSTLNWFEAGSDGLLTQPAYLSISIWWYRLFMLLWALWLASSLIRWLTWGWRQFNAGGCIRRKPAVNPTPPRDTPPALPRS